MRRDSLLYAGGFLNRWLLLSAAAGRRPPARIYYGATGSTDRSHPYTGQPSESIVLPDDPATLSTAFLSSAFLYLPFTEAQRVILATEKDQHVADAKRFILEGVMENTPIWRKKASD